MANSYIGNKYKEQLGEVPTATKSKYTPPTANEVYQQKIQDSRPTSQGSRGSIYGDYFLQGLKNFGTGVTNALHTAAGNMNGIEKDFLERGEKESLSGKGSLLAKTYAGQANRLKELRDYEQKAVGKIVQNTQKSQAENLALSEKYKDANKTEKWIAENVAGGFGQMLPSIALGFVPGVGQSLALGSMGTSAAGSATGEALTNGADLKKATVYGGLSGGAEVAIEKLFGGIPKLGKGLLDPERLVARFIGSDAGKYVVKRLVDATGEGVEEVISEMINPVFKKMTYDKNAKAPTFSDLANAWGGGAVVSAVLGLPSDVSALRKGSATGDVASVTNQSTTIDDTKNRSPQALKMSSDPQLTSKTPHVDTPVANESVAQNSDFVNTPTNAQYMQQSPKNAPMDPLQISRLKPERANTTPDLNRTNEQAGNRKSKFYDSLMKSENVDPDFKAYLSGDENNLTYDGITNAETMSEAYYDLVQNGDSATLAFMGKNSETATAKDVATGFILVKQYQDKGDLNGFYEVVKQLRKIGTTGGQVVQMFSILNRMTPEGMAFYAQKGLDEAWDVLSRNKTNEWKDANRAKYQLTPEDMQFIEQKISAAQQLPEGRDKDIQIAQISARIQKKIPPSLGRSFKSFTRINMLLNPKTNVRNILGNTIFAPFFFARDFIGSGLDKAISAKTGVRTTGNSLSGVGKAFKRGAIESYEDFRLNINTRKYADRFEVKRGTDDLNTPYYSFNDNTKIGRALNTLDRLTSFALDAGDRPYFEGWFVKSLNNQMRLNNVTEPTADMIEIATNDALQATWQDTNTFTKTASAVRRLFNGGRSYGFGDFVAPFIQTPANLTKAVVDFSPVGLTKALTADAWKFRAAVRNGTNTPQMQRNLVKNIGAGVAGTLLMAFATGLAYAGVTTGEGDEDKDVASFERNVLGIRPFSVKVGDKSYAYDWAQPLAGHLAIGAQVSKDIKAGTDTFQTILSGLGALGDTIMGQGFLQGMKNLFSSDDIMGNVIDIALAEPLKYLPQFGAQIAALGDDTARTTYAYKDPLSTLKNQIALKVPGARNTLLPSVDTLGRDVKADNSVWNVMFNPALNSSANPTAASEEMYRVYQQTGDKGVIPKVAPYYFVRNGQKTILTPEQKTQYQRTMGTIASTEVAKLLKDDNYNGLSDTNKAAVIKKVYEYAEAKAKESVSDYSPDSTASRVDDAKTRGLSPSTYYSMQKAIDSDGNGSLSTKEIERAMADSPNKAAQIQSEFVFSHSISELSEKQQNNFKTNYSERNMTQEQYLEICNQLKLVEGNKDKNGETISGSLKNNRYKKLIELGYSDKWAIWILNHDYGYKPPYN